jgi:hypothetical protein
VNFMIMLLGLAVSMIAPGKRMRRASRSGRHRRFYRQGFMVDEIDALESVLDSENLRRPPRRR